MPRAEQKTKETSASVTDFLNAIEDEQKRKDCLEIAGLMEQITKEQPKMWGSSIVGYGFFHYKYASGHEGDTMLMGFRRVSKISRCTLAAITSGFQT